MHIAIPYPMETVRTTYGESGTYWGRDVATHSFLSGLYRASSIHKITLWVPTLADAEFLNRTLLTDLNVKIPIISGFEFTRYFEENPIDILHVMDPNMWIGGHIRNQLTDHDFIITGMTHSLGNKHFLEWCLLNNANGIEHSDCLVCTTPTAQSVVTSIFSRFAAHQSDFSVPQTEVIPLGIDLDKYRQPTILTRQDLGLPPDEFLILSLGRFNPVAKMDLLPIINLIRMLREKTMRKIRLILAGSSNQEQYIRLLQDHIDKSGLEDTVAFKLNPRDEEKLALFQHADVFLSLSDNLQETFGLTVIEALASGLPVVVSDWNGYRSLVQHGETGYLVPTKVHGLDPQSEASLSIQYDSIAHLLLAQTTAVDLPAACEALANLESDREASRRMSEAAIASAANYDWQKVISRYFALWERLCDERADAISDGLQRNRNTSSIRFSQDFSVYPTTHLSPTDSFVTSELGQLLLQGDISINPYWDTREILNPQIILQILNTCIHEVRLRDLLNKIAAKDKQQSHLRISQNLMWLYKYGYLNANQ